MSKWEDLGFPESVIAAAPFFVFDAMYEALSERFDLLVDATSPWRIEFQRKFNLRPRLGKDSQYTVRRTPIRDACSGIEDIVVLILQQTGVGYGHQFGDDPVELPPSYRERLNYSKVPPKLQKEWVWNWCDAINRICRNYASTSISSSEEDYMAGNVYFSMTPYTPDGSRWKLYGWKDGAEKYIPLQRDERGFFYPFVQKRLKQEDLPYYLTGHLNVTRIDVSSWNVPADMLWWYGPHNRFLHLFYGGLVVSHTVNDFSDKLEYFSKNIDFFRQLTK